MNSHNPFGKDYKSPLSRVNIDQTEDSLAAILSYLEKLELPDGTRLDQCRRNTFILGFKAAAASLLGVGRFVFDEYPHVKYIRAYQLGQDHIETLFSKIRAKGGFNNNPDVVTFKSALRALLLKSDVSPSPSANCIELDPSSSSASCSLLLTSKKKKKSVEEDPEIDEFADENEQLSIDLSKPISDIVEYIGK